MLPDDPLSRVLHIDMTAKSSSVKDRKDLFERYLGGSSVAIRLLLEECPQGAGPLSPENPVVFAVGPLNGLFPLASKTVAMFKSPHNGMLGESHAGGRSATSIRLAGYGAIVIKGSSDRPVYIAVHGNDVSFKDASTLWGMRSSFTAGRVILEKEPGNGLRTLMRIGRAGERLVSYACVTTETYRHFGRLGLGAVFGSKKLKALLVSGKRPLSVREATPYKALYDGIHQAAVSSPVMKKYHDLGTAENVLSLNTLGALPTRNLQVAKFEGAELISGQAMAQNHLGRRLACSHCPVGCVHIAALKEPYEGEAYFYKTTMISYDYELLYSLGSLLGGSDSAKMLRLMDRIELYGLDAMTTGVVLAWATEAQSRGLISERETLGLRFGWGDYDTYINAVPYIVDQTNDFYRALANGVDNASGKFGGADYALAFGGNEMPGYFTGPAAIAGYLIGARHSHLDNAGYGIDQKNLGRNLPPEELARFLVEEERWRQVLSSLSICFFARNLYPVETVIAALATAGIETTGEALKALGAETLRLKLDFKRREGFDISRLRIPARVFEKVSPAGHFDELSVRQAVEAAVRLIDGK